MKKILVSVMVGLVLGGLGGFAVGIFVYPFIFPPPPANEHVADRESRTVEATGTFIHANPSDPIHYGRGSVEILRDAAGQRIVFLKPDFKVGPGPRFHVYLADRAEIRSDDDFRAAETTDLGQLRAFEGSQIYRIPDSLDVSRVKSVVIWCKQFKVLISPATLQRAG
ncbi:MAG TPA: DM13 domain-containing protein [Planctomycetaceae bacterium]